MGGAASGKSAYGEALATALSTAPHYLATLENLGEENRRRIARHRLERAGRGFLTFEEPLAAGFSHIPPGEVTLLECLGTLLANEIFSPRGSGFSGAEETIHTGVETLLRTQTHLILISNTVFHDGFTYDPETVRYQQLLGALNRAFAARAHRVVEVVCGIPIHQKGEQP